MIIYMLPNVHDRARSHLHSVIKQRHTVNGIQTHTHTREREKKTSFQLVGVWIGGFPSAMPFFSLLLAIIRCGYNAIP